LALWQSSTWSNRLFCACGSADSAVLAAAAVSADSVSSKLDCAIAPGPFGTLVSRPSSRLRFPIERRMGAAHWSFVEEAWLSAAGSFSRQTIGMGAAHYRDPCADLERPSICFVNLNKHRGLSGTTKSAPDTLPALTVSSGSSRGTAFTPNPSNQAPTARRTLPFLVSCRTLRATVT
jgi:hypothetical protein